MKFDLLDVNVLSTYPNPVKDYFTVKYRGALSSSKYLVKVVDITGKTVLSKTISADELLSGKDLIFNVEVSGVYVVNVYDLDKGTTVGSAKLVKI